ncbi:MAG: tRNA threonylcarbamoyladenosine dehydratase [Gammaproteobacteria bacterium SHHR-1]|uniref:tRNA threonylcarbamoyladenosine dehydratase n=1 Tax=Magnetovirga frankeli TaxID=947516 RepID=UPI00129401D4|nr:tRNA threonylcarbamoyladenosine dehydratase [gamma proteobacterium SS-5]
MSRQDNSAESGQERRFAGVARLYGQTAVQGFASAHVCVVGVGGVGSWAVEALARSGIGQLSLIDADHLVESNINRQLQALDTTLGMAKTQALGQRIGQINPQARVHSLEQMLSEENLSALLPGDCDYLLDCIDNFRVKAALIHHCKRRKLPLLTLGGAGGKRDPGLIRLADLSRTEHDPLLAKTRKQLRQGYGFSSNPKRRFGVPCIYSQEQSRPSQGCPQSDASLNCSGFGSSMAVTASFGLFAAAQVLKYLSERELRTE